MTRRYHDLWQRLTTDGAGALVPFAMLGDPTPARTVAVLDALVDAGADALELGIPFSDPIADGPIIQAATNRALEAGTTVEACWELLATVRARHPSLPIGLLLYANLVVRRGLDRFYREAAAAGVDSVLLADVPLLESDPFIAAAEKAGLGSVLIVPPNASDRVLAGVAARSTGYTYLTARSGVTGERATLDDDLAPRLARLRESGAAPPLVGFGISAAAQVAAALAAGAAGAIVGSAIVRRIAEGHCGGSANLEPVRRFVGELKAATRADPIATSA